MHRPRFWWVEHQWSSLNIRCLRESVITQSYTSIGYSPCTSHMQWSMPSEIIQRRSVWISIGHNANLLWPKLPYYGSMSLVYPWPWLLVCKESECIACVSWYSIHLICYSFVAVWTASFPGPSILVSWVVSLWLDNSAYCWWYMS